MFSLAEMRSSVVNLRRPIAFEKKKKRFWAYATKVMLHEEKLIY